MSRLCTLLGFFATLVALISWVIRDDEWLLAKYKDVVDIYEVTLAIALCIMAPLMVMRPARVLLQPGFAIARTVLMFCSWAIAFSAVYFIWGTLGVTIGLLFAWVGGLPMAVVACILRGAWPMLAHVVLSTIGFMACLMAELKCDTENWPQDDRAGEAPGSIKQASNSVWVCLVLTLPAMIGTIANQDFGVWIALACVIFYSVLAITIRKGFKLGFLMYVAATVPFSAQYLEWLQRFNIAGIVKLEPDAVLGLFQCMQAVLAIYALVMLLTPTAVKWVWVARPQPNEAGTGDTARNT